MTPWVIPVALRKVSAGSKPSPFGTLVELVALIGYYATQCLVVNAAGIELEEGVEPLLPQNL